MGEIMTLRALLLNVALLIVVVTVSGDNSCLSKEGCCCCHCAGGNKCSGKICCHPDDVCTTADGTVFDVRAQQKAALEAHEAENNRRKLEAAAAPADAEEVSEEKPEVTEEPDVTEEKPKAPAPKKSTKKEAVKEKKEEAKKEDKKEAKEEDKKASEEDLDL